MTSITDKVKLFIQSNLHDALDAAINWNDIGAVRQRVRYVQEAKDKVRNEAAGAKGRVAAAGAEVKHYQECIAKCERDIDLVLTDGDDSNDHLAVDIQKKLDGFQAMLETKQGIYEAEKQGAEALAKVSQTLHAKFEEAVAGLKKLESLKQQTDSKEAAAKAMKTAASIAGSVGGAGDFDTIESKMRQEAAVADAKLADAMGEVASSTEDDVATIRAKQAIAARRAKLAGGSAVGSGS